MIYFIGGAPRVGKSILAQQFAARMQIGWIATDLMEHLLQFKNVEGTKTEWDASPEAVTAAADWFFPCLDLFTWEISQMAAGYVIEGVDFLPRHIARLSASYPVRSVFLGCAHMTPERFDQFPGRSPGYSFLPEETRRRFAQDIPRWSEFIRQEAERYRFPYVDTSDDFESRLKDAMEILSQKTDQAHSSDGGNRK